MVQPANKSDHIMKKTKSYFEEIKTVQHELTDAWTNRRTGPGPHARTKEYVHQ